VQALLLQLATEQAGGDEEAGRRRAIVRQSKQAVQALLLQLATEQAGGDEEAGRRRAIVRQSKQAGLLVLNLIKRSI
ncbi:hypothetical protein EWI25_31370, partial [Pseudomonas aeruginosa]